MTGSQLAARRNLEQYLSKKAQEMLDKVLGPGQAVVRVAAEINYDTLTRTDEKFDPDGQVVRTQTKNDESTDSTTTTPGAQPAGITSNTSTSTNNLAAGPVNDSKNRKTTSTIEYEIGRTTSSLVSEAGGIKRLTASVTVAAQVQSTNGTRTVIARTADELDKLKRVVAGAVGIDATRGDVLTVEEMPFNDDFANEVTQQLDTQQKHDLWLNLARSLAYPALGLLALFVLFRLFKSTPVQEIPLGVPVGRLNARLNGNGGNGHSGPAPRFGEPFEIQPGVVTVDVLNKLVKENPVNMTQAIRDWMNKGPGRAPEHN